MSHITGTSRHTHSQLQVDTVPVNIEIVPSTKNVPNWGKSLEKSPLTSLYQQTNSRIVFSVMTNPTYDVCNAAGDQIFKAGGQDSSAAPAAIAEIVGQTGHCAPDDLWQESSHSKQSRHSMSLMDWERLLSLGTLWYLEYVDVEAEGSIACGGQRFF